MEAILAFVSGRDVFVSLPTGYGKSICYASLPFVFDTIRGKDSMGYSPFSPRNIKNNEAFKFYIDCLRHK